MNIRKTLWLIVVILFLISKQVSGQVDMEFVSNIKDLVYANYDNIKEGKKVKTKVTIIEEIEELARKYNIKLSKEYGLLDFLEGTYIDCLNRDYFEKDNKYLIVSNFRNESGLYAIVVLAGLIKKENKIITLDNKKIEYQSVFIGNPIIKSYVDYISDYDHFTWLDGEKVFHNFERYKNEGKKVFDVLKKGYSRRGRLYYNLIDVSWRAKYDELIKSSKDKQEAKEIFAETYANQSIEDITFHEAYHLVVRGTPKSTKDFEEEVRAEYTRYMHSNLGPYILTDMITALKSPNIKYVKAGKKILNGFVEYIKEEQKKGNFMNINIEGDELEEQSQDFYKLKGEDIKKIAGYLYEQR